MAAVNGDLARLLKLHKTLFEKIAPGDRLVYTGNYLTGPRHAQPLATIDEILYFRRTMMARHGLEPEDFVYLRGTQEALWDNILRLQFMPNPLQVIEWMSKKHPEMELALSGYGVSFNEAMRVAREGVISMTRWTSMLKLSVRQQPGHEKFFAVMHRAAFTENSSNDNLLFVHSGIDPKLDLMSQGDNFWWASKQFSQMQGAYHPFKSVIRGYDPEHQGLKISPSSISLDGNGQLLCAEIGADGQVVEVLAA